VNSSYLSMNEVCTILSISPATCRNWVRLKKLTPATARPLQFYKKDISRLKRDLSSGKVKLLSSRRNKTYIKGNSLYKAYLHEDTENLPVIEKILDSYEQVPHTEERSALILAEYALKLLNSAWHLQPEESLLLAVFFSDTDSFSDYRTLIHDLLHVLLPEKQAMNNLSLFSALEIPEMKTALSQQLSFVAGQDYLGLLYLSMQNIGGRKAKGAYYTPSLVVDRMTASFCSALKDKPVIDPCCGTGNFLISLSVMGFSLCSLHGMEKDPAALALARVNLALYHPVSDLSCLYENLQCGDTLHTKFQKKYACILGNPPWGSSFTEKECTDLGTLYETAAGKPESSSIFFEHALRNATDGCMISFVLPEAFLTVASYLPIRKLLLEESRLVRIEYLDNAFDGVQCPSIILTVVKQNRCNQSDSSVTIGTTIVQKDRSFQISVPRSICPSCFNFTANDNEYAIVSHMDQLKDRTTLKGQAFFALGIVTGNNSALLYDAPGPGRELIYKGKHIQKYKVTESDVYADTALDKFQQSAPEAMYRAPEKLLYRFINKSLIFAYDDKQRLTLNSCNILIPDIPGLHIKYILAVLNSSQVQFYFTHKFNSVKILRSHLEQIPIPVVSAAKQMEVVTLVDQLEKEKDPVAGRQLQMQIDTVIRAFYQLD